MGRAKLKIEFVANKKARASVFKRRKQGLIKKLQQLVTLCDVDACMLIHFPDAPEIWPPAEIRRMIDLYRTQDSDSGTRSINVCGVSDFSLDPKKTQDFNVGVAPDFALDNKFLCTQTQTPPMSIIPHFHIPPHYSYGSMDPQWQWMDAVVDSQEAGGSSENTNGGQFFQRCSYTPPNLHQSLMTSSIDHLNIDDITWTFDFL